MEMDNRSVRLNKKSNLLKLDEYMYPLVDTDKPNVFRNLFPYEEVPKIAFNDRIVPHEMPEDIWITDTTFRDGQQSRTPYSTDQIVHIYDAFHRLGGPKGIIRQCEFFFYSKRTEMPYINVWKKDTNFQRLQAGFVQVKRTLN